MKKVSLLLIFCLAVILSGCSNKQEPLVAKIADVNKTESKNKQQAVKEVNKTIKRTNVTINSYSDCPSFTTSDYKTIPYE
jgi:PBP1b-binding outer membrane lipoprotein LpoB